MLSFLSLLSLHNVDLIAVDRLLFIKRLLRRFNITHALCNVSGVECVYINVHSAFPTVMCSFIASWTSQRISDSGRNSSASTNPDNFLALGG
jgi:hypothetical protein